MATNGNGSFHQQEQYKNTEQYPATSGATDSTTGNSTGTSDVSKDEVGWYFVEQYYTTLSKNPEKLHLFYGTRSQFVSGLEAEVAQVSVGRKAIQERIRDLDFQDCKVRVSNVDSQSSFDNIVIQVIGETSNNSAELKKFVQTFVLAQQPTGYFVLNDIFRYIIEEGEEENENAGTTEATRESEGTTSAGPLVEDVEMPKAQTSVEEPVAALDTEVVDKKLETIETKPTPVEEAPSTNGTAASKAEETAIPEVKAEEEIPTPEAAEKAVDEEIKIAEKPAEPTPTPAISRLPSAVKPATPAQPPKPMSWASRAAAAAGPSATPKTVVPAIPKSVANPTAQAKAAPQNTPAKPTQQPQTAAAPAAEKEKENVAPGSGGWQSVSNDAKRQNRAQSVSSPPEREGTMGYVRNVTEKVLEPALRETLSSFGKLIYFDINRSKNCAFVEYEAPEGYQAAAAANPHKVSGEDIYVEPRRPKSNAYGGNSYTGPRGGINQRGRGNFEQGRPGTQGGGRGNFNNQNRGRGGGGAPRGGRGASQATANS